MGMCEMRKHAQNKVTASRVTAQDKIRGTASLGVYQVVKKLDGLFQLSWVLCFWRNGICEKKYGNAGTKRLLEVVKP